MPPLAAHRLARWTAFLASGAILLLSAGVLVAWAFLAVSNPYRPASLPMLPNAAMCFLALGAGLLALMAGPSSRARWQGQLLGATTSVFGLLALLETTHQLGIRMNTLFTANPDDVVLAVAARTSPVASLDFILAGLTLAILATPWRGTFRPVLLYSLASVPLSTSFVGLLQSGLRTAHVLQGGNYESLSPALSLGFVLFSLALTATHESLNPHASLLFDSGVQGRLVRRVAPVALVILTISTGAGLIALDRGLITPSAVLSLLLVINGLSLSGLLAVSAGNLARPLRLLQRYLEQVLVASPSPLAPLPDSPVSPGALRSFGDDPSEFRDIARLLGAFVEQRQALIHEIAERGRVEQALRASESKYRLLLENFPHAVALVENGKISFANPAAARLFGQLLGQDLVGLDLLELVCEPERGRCEQLLDFVVQGRGGAIERFETYMQCPNGEEFAAEIHAEALPASDAPTLQLVLSDISAEQRKQQLALTHTRRLEVLLKKTAHLFAATDLDEKLHVIADAIRALGWMRVRILECDTALETTRLVSAGFSPEEETELARNRLPGSAWRELFAGPLDGRGIGDFYYLPAGDAWTRRHLAGSGEGASVQNGWNPSDLVVAALHGGADEILGIVILDEPIVCSRPIAETLEPVGLFVHLAAISIAKHRSDDRLRQSEETLTRAQETAHLGNWDLDLSTNELRLSAETQRILGLAPQESRLAFAGYLELVHPDDREMVDLAFHDALRADALLGFDHRTLGADEGERVVHLQAEVVTGATGRARRLVGTLQDVTERLRIEAELREALERADTARRTRSQLLERLGQEARAYIYALGAAIDRLAARGFTTEQVEGLAIVQQTSDGLRALLDEILDFALIEAGKLQLEPAVFDLLDGVHETVKALTPRALEKNLDLAYHVRAGVPDALLGDGTRLRQILQHLLDNAVQFTPRGQVILEVGCESRTESDACLHFTVRDTGIGIAPERQKDIFSALGSTDRSAPDTVWRAGLGLAIAARLVLMMGGKIWLESAVGQGSSFHFTVRFKLAPPDVTAPAALEPPAAWYGLRVLAVEGSPAHRRILDETLRRWGLRPTVVDGMIAARTALDSTRTPPAPFDLVIADVTVPGTAGLGPVQEIQHLVGAAVPMILTCSEASPGVDRTAVAPLPSLTRPLHPRHLLNAMASALQASRPEPEPQPGVSERSILEAVPARPLRILLVEDNIVNQKLARCTLERRGHHVVVVADGRSALAALETQDIDVVLMDLQIPEMNGLEATAAIRERERKTGDHVRILAMTAHAMKGDRERCLAAGMDGYLSKPIQLQEFIDLVEGSRLRQEPRS